MSTAVEISSSQRIQLGSLRQKTIHLAIFGCGNVGSQLIAQLLERQEEILKRRSLNLEIFCIANSKTMLLGESKLDNWEEQLNKSRQVNDVFKVIQYAKEHQLGNLVLVDNTASNALAVQYPLFVEHGFHLVSSNKIANTLSLDFYTFLRQKLTAHTKEYLYETNVGAGLPLIDTIRLLHLSGENITRIRGVFSGSLSFLCNEFSETAISFSALLRKAVTLGYTEPDPREDLGGKDVARKLLILARELDLHNEMEDVSVQNLIPKELRKIPLPEFFDKIEVFDVPFQIKKKGLREGEVLRYVADLKGELMDEHGAHLSVGLVSVKRDSPLGQLQGTDSLFEIYTNSYGDKPIVIQGAGAGAKVTARGVFGDILRISEKS